MELKRRQILSSFYFYFSFLNSKQWFASPLLLILFYLYPCCFHDYVCLLWGHSMGLHQILIILELLLIIIFFLKTCFQFQEVLFMHITSPLGLPSPSLPLSFSLSLPPLFICHLFLYLSPIYFSSPWIIFLFFYTFGSCLITYRHLTLTWWWWCSISLWVYSWWTGRHGFVATRVGPAHV